MNRFEDAVHTARRTTGELAPEGLSEHWLDDPGGALRRHGRHGGYAVLVELRPALRRVPGYVYAYAYGYLFSLAIFQRYEEEGDALVEPYFELLRAGGSQSPEELARIVGLDLADPAIWASGIDALASSSTRPRRWGYRAQAGPRRLNNGANRASLESGTAARYRRRRHLPRQGVSMRRVVFLAGGARRSARRLRGVVDGSADRGRGHSPDGHDRRDVPADGARVALRD